VRDVREEERDLLTPLDAERRERAGEPLRVAVHHAVREDGLTEDDRGLARSLRGALAKERGEVQGHVFLLSNGSRRASVPLHVSSVRVARAGSTARGVNEVWAVWVRRRTDCNTVVGAKG
jgi:hypothetical protein